MDEYDYAEIILRFEELDDTWAEEAADRLVRYGMFTCPERVEPVICDLIEKAPNKEARRYLIDTLSDYDVPLSDGLKAAIKTSLKSDCRWEFCGAVIALLRSNKDHMLEEYQSWVMEGFVTGDEKLRLIKSCMKRLQEEFNHKRSLQT